MEVLIDYLAGELSPSEVKDLENKLKQSPDLRAELDDLKLMYQELKELPVLEPSESLRNNFSTILEKAQTEIQPEAKVVSINPTVGFGAVPRQLRSY